MSSRTLVSVEEYLHTTYDPDCDYVDGELEERNVGELDHSDLQGRVYSYFLNRSRALKIYPYVALRTQVSPTRFRIPDICVVAGPKPTEQVLTHPPLIAIEILSKDDRMSAMQEKIADHLKFGVRYVWVIDPVTRRAWEYSKDGARESKDGILRTKNPASELPLPEIFQALE
ncbi:MAG TPA: Uma2 family endonuclease [Bryobacteraceae bacterium]|nr:Uma2 family endonuclease [Bryobacteraceae bacterium]